MSEQETDLNPPKAAISVVDSARINSIASVCNSFDEIPPELVEIAKDNQQLKTIAENMHIILSGDGDVKFTAKDRKTLEQAICNLAYHANMQPATAQPDNREQNNQLKEMRQQLVTANEQIRKLEDELTKQSNNSRLLQNQIDTLKAENNEYFEKLTQSDEKNNKLRKDNNTAQTQLKAEITQLQDTIQDLRDKLKMSEISINRLNLQVEQSNKELSEANIELNKLKSNDDSKRIKIKNLQSEKVKQNLKIQELEAEKSRLISEQNQLINSLKEAQEQIIACNPENIKHLEDQCEGYRNTIGKLQELTDSQATDIVELRNEQTKMLNLVQKQNALVQAYDTRINQLQGELNEANNHNHELNTMVDNLQSRVDNAPVKSRDIDCSSMLEEMDPQTKELISKKFGDVTSVKLPDVLNNLVDSETNDELRAQNARLISALENQLRFLQSAAAKGVISTALLSPESQSDPLIDEKTVRDKMLIEIARTKQFITSNRLDEGEEQSQKLSEKEIKAQTDQLDTPENLRQREAFAVIALEAENSDIMRRYCDKLKNMREGIVSQLNVVGEALNVIGEPEEIIKKVIDVIMAVQNFSKKIKLILDGDFNEEDFESTSQFITKYAQSSSLILKHVDNELRQAVKFDGELQDLPFYAVEVVNDLLKMITATKEQSVADMRSQLDRIKAEAEAEQEKLVESVAKLEKDIEHLREVNDQLLKKVDVEQQKTIQAQNAIKDVEAEKAEVQEKLSKIMANYSQIENELDESREENEKIREQLKNKSSQFEQRLEQMLQNQREQHVQDMQNFEQKLQQREEKLREEINAKHIKLQETKSKLREVISTYDSAFKQQKEATAVLRQQNQELIMRLQTRSENKSAQQKANNTSTAEVEQLKTDLKTALQEKAILESKLQQTISAAESARQVRDSYWESQLSMQQQTMERSIHQESLELEAELSEFTSQVKSALKLDDSIPQEKIVEAAGELSKRVEKAEEELDALKKQRAARQAALPQKSADYQKVQQTVQALQEWDRWARDLYVNCTDGDIPSQSAKDLRFVIGEMALASIGHRQLIYRLEALRAQKKAFVNADIPKKSEGPLKMRSTILYVQFAFRLLRKAGNI